MFKKGYTPWNKTKKYRRKSPFIGICTYCKIQVELCPSREKRFKFCSVICKHKSLEGQVPWNKGTKGVMKVNNGSFKKDIVTWNNGMGLPQRFCVDCSKRVWRQSFRCKICFAKWKFQTKENHPRWKVDRSLLAKKQERGDSAYREWRQQVWLRDNFKCKIANPDCQGKIIVHHILGWASYPELRYQINNGITLCRAHHPLKRAEEKRLVPFFQELVPVLN